MATLLCHIITPLLYYISHIPVPSIQLSLFAGNLRLRACLCLAPPPVADVSVPRRLRIVPPHSRHSKSQSQLQSSESDIRRLLHGDLQQPAAGVQRGAGTCSQGAAACSSAYTGLIQLQGASTELQKSA